MSKNRYGPYMSNFGHLFFVDVYPNGSRKSVWVHRELMEIHLGRKLTDDEVVHHRNEIKSDNRLENLEVKTVAAHASDHTNPPEMWIFECLECGKVVALRARAVKHNQINYGKEGPFCGRSCAGTWNQRKQKTVRGKRIGNVPHGTVYRYQYYKCRCDLCREANTAKAREDRARKRGRSPIR